MPTTLKHIFLGLLTVLFLMACDNNQNTGVDASIDPELLDIAIGPVDSDGNVYVKMPAEIYGDSTGDLVDATVDIYLNGGLVLSGVEVESLFNPLPTEIIFNFSVVAEGDTLGFMANLIDGFCHIL